MKDYLTMIISGIGETAFGRGPLHGETLNCHTLVGACVSVCVCVCLLGKNTSRAPSVKKMTQNAGPGLCLPPPTPPVSPIGCRGISNVAVHGRPALLLCVLVWWRATP
ncbi:unnamed protein product [Boreogadus saida]